MWSILTWLLHSKDIIRHLGLFLTNCTGTNSRESGQLQASFLFKWGDLSFYHRVSRKFGLRTSAWVLFGTLYFLMFPPHTYNTHISEDEPWVSVILTSSSGGSSQQNFSFKMTICKKRGFRGGRSWERPGRPDSQFPSFVKEETEAQWSAKVVDSSRKTCMSIFQISSRFLGQKPIATQELTFPFLPGNVFVLYSHIL